MNFFRLSGLSDNGLARGAQLLRRFQRVDVANGNLAQSEASSGHTSVSCRTVFISDTHLGTTGCQARYLLDFLENHRAETIYLVGDIIDGWQLRKDWYWNDDQQRVVKLLFERARTGTRVVFIPGNHDEFAREFYGVTFGCIEVRPSVIHTAADGRKFLVTHGDQFDGIVQHAKWLAFVGDTLYVFILCLNRRFNRIRARLGLSYWSLSQYLKHKVKNAVSFISDFETALINEAKRRGTDGVVCGHIHKAQIRWADKLLYINCGDWVESLTGIVESYDGQMSLVAWEEIRGIPLSGFPSEPDESIEAPNAVQESIQPSEVIGID